MQKKRRSPAEIERIQRIMTRTVKRYGPLTFLEMVGYCYKEIPINPDKLAQVNLLRNQLPRLRDVRVTKKNRQWWLEWKPRKRKFDKIVPPTLPPPQAPEAEQPPILPPKLESGELSIDELFAFARTMDLYARTLQFQVATLFQLISNVREQRKEGHDDGQRAAEEPGSEGGE